MTDQSLTPLGQDGRALGLAARLAEVRAEVADAARAAGRNPQDVRLVAVSKTYPAADVRALAAAGQRLFGESYAQEALPKREELAGLGLEWHFIGRLQTNKAKYVAGNFALVHAVDSLRLAQALQDRARGRGLVQGVLLQVNLAGEAQKGGVSADAARELAAAVLGMEHLRLAGLMLMPPFFDDPEGARPYFAGLRELRGRLERELGARLPELSMGMTGDFRAAVAEGATLVRIGTRIFGERA